MASLTHQLVHSQKIIIIENPRGSWLWELPQFAALLDFGFVDVDFQHCKWCASSAKCRAKWTRLRTNCPALQQLAGPWTLICRGASMITYLLLQGRQNTMLKWFKQCPASFALKCPKEDTPWLQTIPLPIFRLLNLISDVALQLISNQGANNFLQSFPNLKYQHSDSRLGASHKYPKFLRSGFDGVSLRRNLNLCWP